MTGGTTVRFLRARTKAAIALSVIVVVAVSGCTTQSAAVPLPEKNIGQWTSPVDEFMPTKDVAASYASLLLDARCMDKAGYSGWAPPWRDTDPDPGPGWNAVGIRLFNAELASSSGYRIPPAVRSDANAEWQQYVRDLNRRDDPGENKHFEKCRDENQRKHRDVNIDGRSLNLAMGYASLGSDKARASSEVKAAAERWRDCMKPQGISDLPETPESMPSHGLDAKYGIPDDLEGPAAAGEIDVAVADAKCRESSGYTKAFYTVRWNETARLYRENYDELLRVREKLRKHDAAVQKVIDEYAPPRPAGR